MKEPEVSLAQANAGLDPLAEIKAKIEGMLAALKALRESQYYPHRWEPPDPQNHEV